MSYDRAADAVCIRLFSSNLAVVLPCRFPSVRGGDRLVSQSMVPAAPAGDRHGGSPCVPAAVVPLSGYLFRRDAAVRRSGGGHPELDISCGAGCPGICCRRQRGRDFSHSGSCPGDALVWRVLISEEFSFDVLSTAFPPAGLACIVRGGKKHSGTVSRSAWGCIVHGVCQTKTAVPNVGRRESPFAKAKPAAFSVHSEKKHPHCAACLSDPVRSGIFSGSPAAVRFPETRPADLFERTKQLFDEGDEAFAGVQRRSVESALGNRWRRRAGRRGGQQ